MSSNNFTKILDTAINSIKNTLTTNYIDLKNKTKLEFLDSKSQVKLQKQINTLKKQIDSLEKQRSELQNNLTTLDPIIPYYDRKDLEYKYPNSEISSYSTVSEAKAIVKLINSSVNLNREEFNKIAARFVSMMQLAVWGKEQRNVLLNFYSLDWKSLGIDIPTDLNINNIQIKDGKIIADTTLLLTKGK